MPELNGTEWYSNRIERSLNGKTTDQDTENFIGRPGWNEGGDEEVLEKMRKRKP